MATPYKKASKQFSFSNENSNFSSKGVVSSPVSPKHKYIDVHQSEDSAWHAKRSRIQTWLRIKPQLKRTPNAYLRYAVQPYPKQQERTSFLSPSPSAPTSILMLLGRSGSKGYSPSEIDELSVAASLDSRVLFSLSSPLSSLSIKSKKNREERVEETDNEGQGSSLTVSLDQVFDSVESEDKDLCKTMVPLLLKRAYVGLDSTVLVNGPCGSGKTHTMNALASVLAKEMIDRFGLSAAHEDVNSTIEMSYLQLLGSRAYDLISPPRGEDPNGIPLPAPHCSSEASLEPRIFIQSFEEVENHLRRAELLKSTTSHALNARSSRSHCILSFIITQCWKGNPALVTRITLIDLAVEEQAVTLDKPLPALLTDAAHADLSFYTAPQRSPMPVKPSSTSVKCCSALFPLLSDMLGLQSSLVALPSSSSRDTQMTSRSTVGHPLLVHYLSPLLRPDSTNLVLLLMCTSAEVSQYQETVEMMRWAEEISRGQVKEDKSLRISMNAGSPFHVGHWRNRFAFVPEDGLVEMELMVTTLDSELRMVKRISEIERSREAIPQPRVLPYGADGSYLTRDFEQEEQVLSAANNFFREELLRARSERATSNASRLPPFSSVPADSSKGSLRSVLTYIPDRAEAQEALKALNLAINEGARWLGQVDPQMLGRFDRLSAYILRCEALLESFYSEKQLFLNRLIGIQRDNQLHQQVISAKEEALQLYKEKADYLLVEEKLHDEIYELTMALDDLEMTLYRERAEQAVRYDTLMVLQNRERKNIMEQELLRQLESQRETLVSLEQKYNALENDHDTLLQLKSASDGEVQRLKEAFQGLWQVLSPMQRAQYTDYGGLARHHTSNKSVAGEEVAPSVHSSTQLPQRYEEVVLKAKLKVAQQDLEQARGRARDREETMKDLQKEVERVTNAMSEKDAHYEMVQKESDELRQYVLQLESKLVEAVVFTHREVSCVRAFQMTIQELQESNLQLTTHIEELRSETKRLNLLLLSHHREKEDLQQVIFNAEQRIQELKQQLTHRSVYFEKQLKEMEKQIFMMERKSGKTRSPGFTQALDIPGMAPTFPGMGKNAFNISDFRKPSSYLPSADKTAQSFFASSTQRKLRGRLSAMSTKKVSKIHSVARKKASKDKRNEHVLPSTAPDIKSTAE